MHKKLNKVLKRGDNVVITYNRREINCVFDMAGDEQSFEVTSHLAKHQLRFRVGDNVMLTTVKEGIGIIKAEVYIKNITQLEKGVIIILDVQEHIKHIQRREFFRLNVIREISVANEDNDQLKGITQNISAGGIKCILPKPLAKDTTVQTSFRLYDDHFELLGVVLDSQPHTYNKYTVRIRFSNADQKIRQRLISNIFRIQAKGEKA